MNNMKIDRDEELNTAYIYIKDRVEKGEAKKTIAVNDEIILDFSEDMKLLGIEILNAEKYLGSAEKRKVARPA
ncbi:TPA: DUF2283 domain-containing protein [archaeon]|uniref:DUF2283 domain-containing protein n=1 Tax=Candidatus Naiadarchaeum limnaeum TaxID=2756139 RepID=A0A832UUM3_9ARCH|nr:DUF2283 domain-containing protein [Candidatus Naiadarchaeales archaeon SRR2090153.bin1042]HIJ99994.1 DUF2283 domain-containing protein [Candidatus Naiadarchaeum limnaeum]